MILHHLNRYAVATFGKLIAQTADGYLKLDNTDGTFMPVILEKIATHEEGEVWSLAHYFEQNSDLCADPEMTFFVCPHAIYPLSFQMQGSILARYENSMYIENGKLSGYNPRRNREHTTFANMWLKNIKDQQRVK